MTELEESPWRRELERVHLVLPDSAEARERSLAGSGATVLYQHDDAVSRAFGTNVTPVAFVLEAGGVVRARHVPHSVQELVDLVSRAGLTVVDPAAPTPGAR